MRVRSSRERPNHDIFVCHGILLVLLRYEQSARLIERTLDPREVELQELVERFPLGRVQRLFERRFESQDDVIRWLRSGHGRRLPFGNEHALGL